MQTHPIFPTIGNFAGLMTVASIAAVTVTSNADAASLLFSSSDSFTDEVTELMDRPELIVSKYNPSANITVTEVQIMIMANLSSLGTVTNTATQAQSFSVFNSVGTFDVKPAVGSPSVLTTLQPYSFLELIGQQRYENLDPNSPVPFGPYNLAGMASASYTDTTTISEFLGSGTITMLPVTEILTGIAGGGGNAATMITTLADATLTIKYFGEETPTQDTPEPATILGLLAVGGLAVSVLKKKLD